jgi:hypothetical protein
VLHSTIPLGGVQDKENARLREPESNADIGSRRRGVRSEETHHAVIMVRLVTGYGVIAAAHDLLLPG